MLLRNQSPGLLSVFQYYSCYFVNLTSWKGFVSGYLTPCHLNAELEPNGLYYSLRFLARMTLHYTNPDKENLFTMVTS